MEQITGHMQKVFGKRQIPNCRVGTVLPVQVFVTLNITSFYGFLPLIYMYLSIFFQCVML